MNSVYWHLKLVDISQSQDLALVTQLMDGTSKLSVESKQVDISGRTTAKDGKSVGCVVGAQVIVNSLSLAIWIIGDLRIILTAAGKHQEQYDQ